MAKWSGCAVGVVLARPRLVSGAGRGHFVFNQFLMNYSMKLTFTAGAWSLALLLAAGGASAQSVLKYVNPNIGTAHSRWFFYTPAAVPYGMA